MTTLRTPSLWAVGRGAWLSAILFAGAGCDTEHESVLQVAAEQSQPLSFAGAAGASSVPEPGAVEAAELEE